MSRTPIKDRNFLTIDYIETMPDGWQKAADVRFRTLGYYDLSRDITQDANVRTLARGNVLTELIYGS